MTSIHKHREGQCMSDKISQTPCPEDFGLSGEQIRIEEAKARKLEMRKQNPDYWTAGLTINVIGVVVGGYLGLKFSPETGGVIWGALVGFVCAIPISHSIDQKHLQALQPSGSYRQYLDAVERHRRSKIDFWLGLTGWAFEHELCEVLRRLGYDATATKGSADGGIDVVASGSGVEYFIQCKAHKNPIGPGPVRELHGVVSATSRPCKGVMVCLGGYTSGARQFAGRASIVLLDISHVLRLEAGDTEVWLDANA